MERVARLLQQNPVFEQSAPALVARLVARASVVRYAADDLVLHDGEPAQRVFALLSGRVKIYHVSPLGDEVTLKLFGAPALFGEAEALGRFPYQENAKALETSEILIIPVELFLVHLKEDHQSALRVLVDVATRLGIASYNQKSLAFHPSTLRLANYLVDYAAWTNPVDAKEWTIDLTQEQMAAAIGVTRRSVAKDIADWKREGVLERGATGYVIRDLDALRRYCDPHRLTICYSLERSPLL